MRKISGQSSGDATQLSQVAGEPAVMHAMQCRTVGTLRVEVQNIELDEKLRGRFTLDAKPAEYQLRRDCWQRAGTGMSTEVMEPDL